MVDQASSGDERIFETPDVLAREVAEWLCALALASDRTFSICLSGGSTPRGLYQCLAKPGIVKRFPWNRVHWFWSDERFVPPDDPASNYRMVREALLLHVPVKADNVHAIPTQNVTPEQAAAEYEATLQRFYGANRLDPGRPLFDVTLLGIGDNGHTASLFPNHPALNETHHWAAAVIGAMPEARITLTYPALNSSRELAFLATGATKTEMIGRARARDPAVPASRIRPVGKQHWFIDRAAAPK